MIKSSFRLTTYENKIRISIKYYYKSLTPEIQVLNSDEEYKGYGVPKIF